MGKVIGIDIGGSTTKIVGFDGKTMISPFLVRANDPIASVYGAFGKFLSINSFKIEDIERIMITGVGSSFVNNRLFGIPTGKVDEFMAIGMGGLFLSDLKKAIIVSMGTGTALVKAENNTAVHLGGTGVGGGTLLGLSNRMLNVRHFEELIETAADGDLSNVDLTIGDISKEALENLSSETTASNFGKISDLVSKADLALGIINLVFQTIGMIAVFNTRIDNIRDVVLTGNLTNVPQAQKIFEQLSQMYDVNFQTPRNAEYATAAGAAICFMEGVSMREIL
ncbi:MAG TPA: type II pantothenate kinase [Ruminiclostridium sp.]|nr:type II pantothenate kinase [Ruminiclostridium sp.]